MFTPEGELNSRKHVEAVLSQTMPLMPDADFAKTKRLLRQPQTLTYLDEVHRKLAALPSSLSDLREAAVRLEGGRRRPERLQGEESIGGDPSGLAVGLHDTAGEGGKRGGRSHGVDGSEHLPQHVAFEQSGGRDQQQACMHQRHRRLTQGLLDLNRLYWNCRTFRTGRRRGQSPYQRLGVLLPEGLDW